MRNIINCNTIHNYKLSSCNTSINNTFINDILTQQPRINQHISPLPKTNATTSHLYTNINHNNNYYDNFSCKDNNNLIAHTSILNNIDVP